VLGEGALERKVGAGLAGEVAADRHPGADAGVAPDRGLDRAAARTGATFDEGDVFALDVPRGERPLEQAVDLLRAGYDQQAGGVAVQAMHDARSIGIAAHPPATGGVDEQLGERALAVPARGVHDEAGGLVDDEQVLVLVGDLEWHPIHPGHDALNPSLKRSSPLIEGTRYLDRRSDA
jgi:hypothetical protein